MLLMAKQEAILNSLQIEPSQLFAGEEKLMQWLVKREAGDAVSLNGKLEQAMAFYEQLKEQASLIDKTLAVHVDALKTQSLAKLTQLEKKLLRAEKRKYSDQKRQLEGLFKQLFPNGGLQERVENFMPFYGLWGKGWLNSLYRHSASFDQNFVMIAYK